MQAAQLSPIVTIVTMPFMRALPIGMYAAIDLRE